ncbi:hypothetical protein Pelo_15187 [Pelomyxa schiedti]|nr:hypothetical protein Pelo_15187 [Pelomyxa schiedti]
MNSSSTGSLESHSTPPPPSSPPPVPLCLQEPAPPPNFPQPPSQSTPTHSNEPSSLAIALAGTPPCLAPSPPLRASADPSLLTQQPRPLSQGTSKRTSAPLLSPSSVPLRPTSPAPSPVCAPATNTHQGEAVLSFSETLFQHLPASASMFKSGRFKVNAPQVQVEFGYHFSTVPCVSAWITVTHTLTIVKLPKALLVPFNSEFLIILPPDKYDEYKGMPINWLAYTLPSDNPMLLDCINNILAATKVTPPLLKKVEDCIMSVSVNAVTVRGLTILHAACSSGLLELVNIILEKNPNIDAQDDRGCTPLMSCLDAQNYDCASALLMKGCKTNVFNSRKRAAIHILLRKACNTQEKLSVLNLLLASGDPNLRSGLGETPLLLAVTEQSNTEAVKLLLEAGADPNNKSTELSPLFLASSFPNCLPSLELLLSYGADPKLGPTNSTFCDVATSSTELSQLLDRWEKGLLPRRYAHAKLFSAVSSVAQSIKYVASGGGGKNKPTLEILKALNAATSSSEAPQSIINPVIERFEDTLALPEFHGLRDSIASQFKVFIKAKYTLKDEGDAVYTVINKIMDLIDSHPKRKTLPERKPLTEQVKRYTMEQLYTHIFNKKELKEQDAILEEKILKMQPYVTPKMIEMREGLDHDLIQSATKELLEIENVKTPQEKLICILNCSKVLVTVLQKAGTIAAADDLFPLFIHVVLYANVPNLHSHFSFIERLSENTASASEAFYFFTTITCVTAHIEEQLYNEVFPETKP